MPKRMLIGGIVVLVLIGGGLLWLTHRSPASPAPSPKTSVTDTTKPQVKITLSAAQLKNVQNSLKVTVSASDNQSVARVEYAIDGSFAGVSYNAPFSMTLDVSHLAAGTHTLKATAFDAAGNSGSASVQFTVTTSRTTEQQSNTTSPSSTNTTATTPAVLGSEISSLISSNTSNSSHHSSGGSHGSTPADTTPPSAPGSVAVSDPGTSFAHVSWTASTDNVGVRGYQIWRNGSLITTTQSLSYDDPTSLPGNTYTYTIVAYDAAGNTSSATPVAISLAAATIFNSDDTPPASDSGDTNSIEVGTKFRATKDGFVTGVRFYKSTDNTGTHTGDLWASDGTNLARVTFTNESASGWQTATFSSPVHITAGTTYIVAYFAPNSHYTGSSHYFDVSHASGSYLTGLQDGTDGSNGVYSYSSSPTFPTSSFGAANYWVDATFVPDTPATLVTKADCSAYPAFPDTTCTGAVGGDNMTTINSSVSLDNSNQVYSNLNVNGNIIVTGCNDTLRNVEIHTGEQYTGSGTPDLFALWLQVPANCTTTIDRVSIIANDAPNNYVTTAIRVANGGPVNITNVQIIGAQIGILTGPGTIKDNYILLGDTQRGDHNEDILEDGTSNLTLDHNTFLNPNNQTSAISLFTENGPNSNLLIKDNLLAGGNYTAFGGDGIVDGQGNPIGPPSNIDFINNVFWRKYYPDAGFFAAGRDYNPASGGEWTNNRYMNADGTLTDELVPQPPPAS